MSGELSQTVSWRDAKPATASLRFWRVSLFGITAIVCLITATWIALWFRLPATSQMLMITTDDDPNWILPHNAYGRSSVTLLRQESQVGTRLPFKLSETQFLSSDGMKSWSKSLKQSRESTIAIYFSLHGARDSTGAFLFGSADNKNEQIRLPIRAVLEEIAQLSNRKRKILILDVTTSPHFPQQNVLHQDFASGLLELESEIAAIPNLIVICSSGVDQRSWISPEWKQTAFGHFLVEGMSGWADSNRDGRLNALELIHYVEAHTSEWVRDHRGSIQTPLVLPRGPEGEKRAANIEIGQVNRVVGTATVNKPEPFQISSELENVWKEYRELAAAMPSPLKYVPHLWRNYADGIRRFEELEVAGDSATSQRVRSKTRALKKQIEETLTLTLVPQTLALGDLQHFISNDPNVRLREVMNELVNRTNETRTGYWQTVRHLPGSDPTRNRIEWCRALLSWIADDPATRLKHAPTLISLVADGLPILPAELHFISMLAQDLPLAKASSNRPALIRKAILIRQLAEDTAVAASKSGFGGGEQILPWLEAVIEEGDRSRRFAEDLLFATNDESPRLADQEFEKAQSIYLEVQQNAEILRQAFAIRELTLAMLPQYANWVAVRPKLKTLQEQIRHAGEVEMIREVWQQVYFLNHLLLLSSPRTNQDRNVQLQEIQRISQQVNSRFGKIQESYAKTIENLLSIPPECDGKTETRAEVVHWLQQALPAFCVVSHDENAIKKHLRLLVETQRVTRLLLIPQQSQEVAIKTPSEEENRVAVFESVASQGLFHLSRLGFDHWMDNKSEQNRIYNEIEFQLRRFPQQVDARQTLITLTNQLDGIETKFRTEVAERATTDLSQLGFEDPILRSIHFPIPLARNPIQQLRINQIENLLLHQATRTLRDGWFGGSIPYYRLAGRMLLSDRERYATPEKAKETLLLANSLEQDFLFPLDVIAPQQAIVTDEPNLAVRYDLKQQAEDPRGYGWPVMGLEPRDGGPNIQLPYIRKNDTAPQEVVDTIQLESNDLQVRPKVVMKESRLNGYFRGQRMTKVVSIEQHPLADRIVKKTAPPTESQLLAVVSPELTRFGTGDGNLALVIDCSGSMRPDPKNPDDQGRFTQSIALVEKLIKQMPRGITLQIWTYGRRKPDAKQSEDTVELTQEPILWDGDSEKTLAAMKLRLQGIEAWDRSPIMRTLIKAKESLSKSPRNQNAIVLISDADDNRFAQDRESNPNRRSISEALRSEFDSGNVRLHVIAFEPQNQEEINVQKQFEVVKELRQPGLFLRPEQIELLSKKLFVAFDPRIVGQLSDINPRGSQLSEQMEILPEIAFNSAEYRRLRAGKYELKIQSLQDLELKFDLDPGEKVLTDIVLRDRKPLAERFQFVEQAPGFKRKARTENNQWSGGIIDHQLLNQNASRIVSLLEDRAKPGILKAAKISDVWWELSSKSLPRVSINTRRNYNYPAPAWQLDINTWPKPGEGQTESATLEAWWSEERPFSKIAVMPCFPKKTDDVPLADLRVGSDRIQIISMGLESHCVSSELEKRTCLTVRLSVPKDEMYWVRLPNQIAIQSEIRWFREANRVSCLFWKEQPWTKVDVASINEFDLLSLKEIKAEARKAGRYLLIGAVPAPVPVLTLDKKGDRKE
jgi:hypothetical protein